jgi:hypothetical protein
VSAVKKILPNFQDARPRSKVERRRRWVICRRPNPIVRFQDRGSLLSDPNDSDNNGRRRREGRKNPIISEEKRICELQMLRDTNGEGIGHGMTGHLIVALDSQLIVTVIGTK